MTEQERTSHGERDHYMSIGIAIGLATFGLLGAILCLATGNPGLLGVGPGIGLAMGVAIGEGLYQRRRRSRGHTG